MQKTGTLNVQPNSFALIPLSVAHPDEWNPIIGANLVNISITIPASFNGILKIYDVVPDDSGTPPVWIAPIRVYEITDGLFNGSNTIADSYPVWFSPQSLWGLVILEGETQISVDYVTNFNYPPQLPNEGYWYSYMDPTTGYKIGLLKFTSDGKIDLNGKVIINQG